MILPSKHINFSESLMGLGGILLSFIKEPISVDKLWNKYSKINNTKTRYPAYHSFDNMVLAINYLYAIDVIDLNDNGDLYLKTLEDDTK